MTFCITLYSPKKQKNGFSDSVWSGEKSLAVGPEVHLACFPLPCTLRSTYWWWCCHHSHNERVRDKQFLFHLLVISSKFISWGARSWFACHGDVIPDGWGWEFVITRVGTSEECWMFCLWCLEAIPYLIMSIGVHMHANTKDIPTVWVKLY